jgi:hypothetical protein
MGGMSWASGEYLFITGSDDQYHYTYDGRRMKQALEFYDIKYNRYRPEISSLVDKGVLQGYNDNTFKPDSQINRAEFLKIILESAADKITIDEAAQNCFRDVREEWFAKYVCTAKELGIIQGYSDGNFKPEQTVNYVEALRMIYELNNLGLYQNLTIPSNQEWYQPYVKLAAIEEIFVPELNRDYDSLLTRDQVAYLIEVFNKNFDAAEYYNENDYYFSSLDPAFYFYDNILISQNSEEIITPSILEVNNFPNKHIQENESIIGLSLTASSLDDSLLLFTDQPGGGGATYSLGYLLDLNNLELGFQKLENLRFQIQEKNISPDFTKVFALNDNLDSKLLIIDLEKGGQVIEAYESNEDFTFLAPSAYGANTINASWEGNQRVIIKEYPHNADQSLMEPEIISIDLN